MRLLDRAQQIQTCYKKYCISNDVLTATFNQIQSAIDSITYVGNADHMNAQISTITECTENLKRRHQCLVTLHEQVAEIEALTLSITEFDMESPSRRLVNY